MRGILMRLVAGACLALGHVAIAPTGRPQIQTLPPLREQAKIVDAWTEERKLQIPDILRKYSVDAWIVCSTQQPNIFFPSPLFPHS